MARSPVNPLVSDPSVTVVVWTGALSALAALQAENARLRAELVQARKPPATRATPAIPREQWRRLMMLVHPDKHGGSEVAVKAAQWLNEVRP